jgi:iron complex outermembrane receptor protein
MKIYYTIFFLICSTFIFSQEIEVTGTVYDSSGNPLGNASIFIEGTKIGTIADFNGNYEIKIKNPNSTLVFSSLGYQSKYIKVTATKIDVKLVEDQVSLDEIIISVGIRGSQLRATKLKREAKGVIEAITPEDVGSFSDNSITDALQRVPGVQVERDPEGNGGERVSIRGIGPQFVTVTVNGRTPISAGSEGSTNLRTFNLNLIPTEVTNSTIISKSADAKSVSSNIGGGVDIETLKPLNKKYQKDKNYFAVINARNLNGTNFEDNSLLKPRISVAVGGKITEKFGVYFAGVYANEQIFSEQVSSVNFDVVDIKEDTNNDGIFDANGGDTLFEDILVPSIFNARTFTRQTETKAFSGGFQWKATSRLEINTDFTRFNVKAKTEIDQLGLQIGSGSNDNNPNTSGLFDSETIFSPGSITFNGNNLSAVSLAGASQSRINIINLGIDFDNETVNNIGGVNFDYQLNDKLNLNLDVSYSDIQFDQKINTIGIVTKNEANNPTVVRSDFSLDLTGEYPLFNLPSAVIQKTDDYTLAPQSNNYRKTRGDNYGIKLDNNYKLDENTTVFAGIRFNQTQLETRAARYSTQDRPGATATGTTPEELTAYNALRVNAPIVGTNFLGGNTGITGWTQTPLQGAKDVFGDISSFDGGDYFNFDVSLKEAQERDQQSGDNFFATIPNLNSFSYNEKTYEAYAQLDLEREIFGKQVYFNVGLRGVKFTNESEGFTFVSFAGVDRGADIIVYNKVNLENFNLLPSFNMKASLQRNLIWRLGFYKGVTRPEVTDLVPSNSLRFSDTQDDLANLTAQGGGLNMIRLSNPNLKPFTSLNFDSTFEYYVKNGGAFVVSLFYKSFNNFIADQVLLDAQYPEELNEVFPIEKDITNDLVFDITQPKNITDAGIYGFEVGFNQHFTSLPGFWSGFGLQANYTFVESDFDDAIGDAISFPGSSKHSVNSVLYYQKYGFTARYTVAYRNSYLSNLGFGSTREDASRFTDARTIHGIIVQYNFSRHLLLQGGVQNITGEPVRRFIGNDSRNLTDIFGQNASWFTALRYTF